jgi:glycosyltransferase involved in cell wall biosynthesis
MPITRYAGLIGNRIAAISDRPFSDAVEVPIELDAVSSNDLVQQFVYRDGKFQSKTAKKPAKELRVAFVTNWNQRCGISTYSKFLIEKIVPHIKDYAIFAEDSKLNKDDFNDTTIDNSKVVYCWKRGESLLPLSNAIKKFNPDIVQIQNEPGLYPNARYWISLLSQLHNYRVITTNHSIFHHLDKLITEAPQTEMIVHSDAAKFVLQNEKQVSGSITTIPHGCFPANNLPPLWDYYKSRFTFIQLGFLHRYKNFECSIRATAILKAKYPDVYFTGICSTGSFSDVAHNAYYSDLMELIERLGVQDNVGLIKGYQSEVVLSSFLRMNKAAVFPYQSNKEHECFGSSGSAPYAMTFGIPCITSHVHHFTDLPTIKINTPEEMAMELSKLFEDPVYLKTQVEKQNIYLAENSWEKTAERYIGVFES